MNAENGENIPLEQATGKFFTTPARNRVVVLQVDDVPTAQGQGAALVLSDFWTRPQWYEFCLLSEGGPKYVRARPTSHARGCDW